MPKLLIDISDDDFMRTMFYPVGEKIGINVENLMRTFQSGIVLPDNATNGELFKTIYSADVIEDQRTISAMELINLKDSEYLMGVGKDWWNALYKWGNRNDEDNN